MSLEDPIIPAQEEETTNKLLSKKRRREPEIIKSESLQKSIEIISKYDFKFTTDEHIIEYKKCFFCKNHFPTIQGNNYSCHDCGETFCVKHRNILDHHCQKLNPKLEKYLAAKRMFREKLRKLKLNH